MLTPMEAWMGIRDGVADDAVKATVFVAKDGCSGVLTAAEPPRPGSAEPGHWLFRISDPEHPDRWHWDKSLSPMQ
jgi:hypothetical protein